MSRSVLVGGIRIGGGAPVSVQSMTNTKTADAEATLRQCRELADAGCDIVRVTVNDEDAVRGFAELRKKTDIPLVADIHFDYRLAIAAVNAGADKIRINPGNIGDDEKVRAVVKACKEAGIPIRVGVNSGSLEKEYGGTSAENLVKSALKNVRRLEDMDFGDIVVSLKASDVRMNTEAYRLFAASSDHPLHVGVTEAGTGDRGLIKSSIGIGSLLMDGIGDTIRVSLTGDPVAEVIAARRILGVLGLTDDYLDIYSCPTCGRTEVDLCRIVYDIEERTKGISVTRPLKVAVMGCAVNGPGEAKDADLGVACGRGEGLLFRRGEALKKVREEDIAEELVRLINSEGHN